MTETKKDISKAIFRQMDSLFKEASEHGVDGVAEHFKAMAFYLGTQMAVRGNPERMDEFINAVIEKMGQGIQSGMRVAHGVNSHLSVQVHSVARSK